MHTLTRRRDPDARHESWLTYYGCSRRQHRPHAPAIRLRATHGNGAAASMDYVPANARLEQRLRSAVMPWPTRSKRPSFYIRERTHHVLDAMGRVRLQANPGRFRGVAARAGMDSKEICRAGAKRTTAALREGRSQPTCATRSQFRNRATRLAWSIPCEVALILALSRPFVHDRQRRSTASALLTSDSTGPSAFR